MKRVDVTYSFITNQKNEVLIVHNLGRNSGEKEDHPSGMENLLHSKAYYQNAGVKWMSEEFLFCETTKLWARGGSKLTFEKRFIGINPSCFV